MKRDLKKLLLLPLVLSLAACPALNITGLGDGVPLQFEVRPVAHGQWLEDPEIAVESATGGLRVHTLLSTPDPCRSFEAAASAHGDVITLAVEVHPDAELCSAVVGTFEYVAVLSGLEAGEHRLRITHTLHRTGDPSPRLVYDADVVVR